MENFILHGIRIMYYYHLPQLLKKDIVNNRNFI